MDLWRRALILAGGATAAAVVGYVGASWYVYRLLTRAEAHCPGDLPQDPMSFTIEGVDTSPYRMPPPEDVTFPSRDDPDVTISAFWEPSSVRRDAPAVIVVHGQSSCKRHAENLLAAGMLHRAGFSVLLIDLRDHGDSTIVDGRFAGGTDEYRDVLGAHDWLRARSVPPERVAVMGTSLGAATSMIAFGEEPGLAAVWADSSYADVEETIHDELIRNGLPTFLAPGGVLVGRFLGVDLLAFSPLAATAKAKGRPIFITHGALDDRLPVRYAFQLAAGVRLAGGRVEPWVVPGAGHTKASRLVPDEYERRLVEFFKGALGTP